MHSFISFSIFIIFAATVSCQVREVIIVHGGAEEIPRLRVNGTIAGIKKAALIGFQILRETGNVLNAVEEAVKHMENDEFFNAANGSMLNMNGEIEMDASIMLGRNLSSGAVTVVKDIANPISLARLVMENNPHSLLAGEGAKEFAKAHGTEILSPGKLITNYTNETFKKSLKCSYDKNRTKSLGEGGGVGAVALNYRGQTASATSAGSCFLKLVGRSSSASVIGAATYADDAVGAVSTSGEGKGIEKFFLARSIIDNMRNGDCPSKATQKHLKLLKDSLNITAGVVTVANDGEFEVAFTSPMMPWAYQIKDELHFGIGPDKHEIEKVPLVKRKEGKK